METEGVPELAHVVVAGVPRVVGGMDADADIEADDEEGEVVAQTEASAESYFTAEVVEVDATSGATGVFLQEPDVTGIDEHGSVELADEGEAVFEVGLEAEVTHLVEVTVAGVLGVVAAGAYGAYAEGADGVGSTYGEEVVVGGCGGVPVGIDRATVKAEDEVGLGVEEAETLDKLSGETQVLGEGYAEEVLAGLLEGLPADGVGQAGEVAGFLQGEGEAAVVAYLALVGHGDGVLSGGNELVAQRGVEGLVAGDDGVELGGGVELFLVVEAEGYDFVVDGGATLVGVDNTASEADAAEVAGAVHPVGGNFVSGGGAGTAVETPACAEEQQSGVGEAEGGTPFVGVEKVTFAMGLCACHPFVGAIGLETEGLSPAEDVLLGHGEADAGAYEAVTLGGDVALELGIVGTVETEGDVNVEGVLFLEV